MEKEIKQLIKKYPMRFKKLKRYFKCYTKEEKEALRNTLEEMCVNGDIYFDGCTYTSMPKNYIVVRVEEMKKNKKTPFKACFVLDSGKVIPIMEDDLNGSLIGDKVILNLKERRVVSVLKREQSVVFCEVIEKDGIKELKPLRVLGAENLYMRISSKSMKKLVIGDIITVNLSTIKSDDIYEADFLSKVGNRRDTSLALKVIAAKHGFYEEYKSDALKELKNIPENVTESDLLDRVDLRNKNIFTIDGVHTKDMDDAVGLTTLEDGNYELIVSIADVAYYIKRNSHLYKEALKRGTSLYMVDTVIPMLPPTISNGICSLNEGVDRLTLSCIIKITPGGKVLSYDVVKSVINSKKKMNYEAVLKVLNGESVTGYDEFRKTLLKMNKLALKLKQKRDLISFASGDIAYTFNDDKEIIDFKKEPSTMATNIIERFMILANHLVSMYSTFLSLPTPYRVHEKPTIDSLETLYQKLKLLSFEIDDCLVNNNYETLVLVDFDTLSYAVYPLEQKDNYKKIIDNIKKITIESNSNNKMKDSSLITKEQVCVFYLSDYIDKMNNNIEEAYNILDEQSKKTYSLEEYEKYVKDNYKKITTSADKCLLSNTDSKRIYTVVDKNKNKYVFNEKDIMNYTASVYFYDETTTEE